MKRLIKTPRKKTRSVYVFNATPVMANETTTEDPTTVSTITTTGLFLR